MKKMNNFALGVAKLIGFFAVFLLTESFIINKFRNSMMKNDLIAAIILGSFAFVGSMGTLSLLRGLQDER